MKRAAGLLERWAHSSRFKNNVRRGAAMKSAQQTANQNACYEEISPAKGEEFASFYKIYADAFPLADEREPPEAFLEIAALNGRTDVQARYGPWREIVAGIRLRQGEPLAGGIIFGVTTSPFHVAFGCQASIQNIYIFLERAARGRGATASAKSHMENCALAAYGFDMCAGKIPPLIFLEVNNPMRMSSAEIEEDTARSGIDPFRRYIYWKRNGFAPLDLHYVQPPLRAEASAVRYLDLFCTAGAADAIPAELIAAHLDAFISISVLKGRAAADDPEFARMTQDLRPGQFVRFVPETSAEQQKIARKAAAAVRCIRNL